MFFGTRHNSTVTIIHDDTDTVKLCINEIRRNLALVKPVITFKSCCLWEYTDDIFDKLNTVLVILSKNTESFVHRIYIAALNQQKGFLAKQTKVCVISETSDCRMGEGLEKIIGVNNVALVHDLQDYFAWLPKLCVFLYQPNKERRYLHKCVIPRIITEPKFELQRHCLINSLRQLGICVSTDPRKLVSYRCGFIMRQRQTDQISKLTMQKIIASEKFGAVNINYTLHYEEKNVSADRRRRNTYCRETQILSIVHLLYVIGLADVDTIHGKTLTRRISALEALRESISEVNLPGYCALSFLNPGLVIFPLTPLPYLALCLYKITRKKCVWNSCLTFWMVLVWMCLYGIIFYILARQTYFLYAVAGYGVVLFCGSVCTFALTRLGIQMFETLSNLSLV